MPAFFTPDDGALVPHPDARGPWAEDMMHGRLLAGLAAWAVERDHGEPGFTPVRLTVDLYKNPRMEPTTVATTLVRAGGRVRAADAVLQVGGVEVARASTLWLRQSEPPEDDAPHTPTWDAIDPEASEVEFGGSFEVRSVGGRAFGARMPRRSWLRDTRELVAGAATTPFVRAALAADFASPLANSSSTGLDYINADLTLHLGRLPVGEWIGIDVAERVASDGVSVASCRFHDGDGPIGWSSVCAVRNARMSP
ncbi:MAG TPA: acyl-CoA thioesterase domain-containing protein [Acidimicrobiales bacterium]|nr:acyl-CoA thioesterase domain-containing protein [Acidimicrobiales bacterium]